MKIVFIFLLNISVALANEVPLSAFDQSKLEQLLIRIPESFVKEERFQAFVRRHYSFPKHNSLLSLNINCSADYYANSPVSSNRKCEVILKDELISSTEESVVAVTNPILVGQLFNAISYGHEKKKIFSTEMIQAVNLEGIYKNTFRYSIICDKKICELKFVL